MQTKLLLFYALLILISISHLIFRHLKFQGSVFAKCLCKLIDIHVIILCREADILMTKSTETLHTNTTNYTIDYIFY